jgi:hypothetical protein
MPTHIALSTVVKNITDLSIILTIYYKPRWKFKNLLHSQLFQRLYCYSARAANCIHQDGPLERERFIC